jgi:Leu/Phe-tRNA-protein transferase
MTPHMEALGARLVPREEFLQLLARTQARGLKLF